jgi:hypothetical protein
VTAETTASSTKLHLVDGWDATLTYDALRSDDSSAVFVGRDELVGTLVNAISQPDRRGTYLISGYRGAGKTSLLIYAAKQAQEPLKAKGRRLLPLVLNVSEVSASLEPATAESVPPLGIDARRLLTALLRALRNGLEEEPAADGRTGGRRARDAVSRGLRRVLGREPRALTPAEQTERELAAVRTMVGDSYRKASAASYSQRSGERAVAERTSSLRARASLRVADVLRVVGALAVVAMLAVPGLKFLGVAVTIAGVLGAIALIAFQASWQTTRRTTNRQTAETRLEFDNSLHQVETDLKEILDQLDACGRRTIFVLEELDKVKDSKGEQLDAVIRYFKNLFTQAPALFFFLTDREYFDVVDGKINEARREGSYAVEHTFFTNRLFVGRPGLEDCLRYLDAVIAEAGRAVEAITASEDERLRAVADMVPHEAFLRFLLLSSDNHLFDLKNEMRRFVSVNGDRLELVVDQRSFTPQEARLAAFHFLLEQKLRLFRTAGRDYANEVLRDSLSAVFNRMGSDELHEVAELLPKPGDGGLASQLRASDRNAIERGLESLLSALSSGGAIKRESQGAFSWVEDAAIRFAPVAELEEHEEHLREDLQRTARISRQFGHGGILESAVPDAGEAESLTGWCDAETASIQSASRPLTSDDVRERSGEAARRLSSLMLAAHEAHRQRLETLGWELTPASSRTGANRWLASLRTAPDHVPVLLVYSPEAELSETAASQPEGVPPAFVLVDDDPAGTEQTRRALVERWRASLAAPGIPQALGLAVPLSEDLRPSDVGDRWGEVTADELTFAHTWTELRSRAPAHPAGPVWLRDPAGQERGFEDLQSAIAAWLDSGSAYLGAPCEEPEQADDLIVASAAAAPNSTAPKLLVRADGAPPDAGGRLIPVFTSEPPDNLPARAVLAGNGSVHGLPPGSLTLLLRSKLPVELRDLASFTELYDSETAQTLYGEAANGGDLPATAALVVALGSDAERVRPWIDRLVASRKWDLVRSTAAQLAPQPGATTLWQQAADAGDAESLAELLIQRPPGAPEPAQLVKRLIASRAWPAVARAGKSLGDEPEAEALLRASATGGHAPAVVELIRRSIRAGGDEAELQGWIDQLLADEDWPAVGAAAAALGSDKRADQLYDAAALGGDVPAIEHVVLTRGDESAVAIAERGLREAGGSYVAWELADRLDKTNPALGIRLHRIAADLGAVASMLEVLVRCVGTDPEASRENQTRLEQRNDVIRLRRAAERLHEQDPGRAGEIEAWLAAKDQHTSPR